MQWQLRNSRLQKTPSPPKRTRITIFATIAIVAMVLGCATSGPKQVDKIGAGFGDFRNEVVNLKTAVNQSMAYLDQTVEDADKDPRKAFSDFSKSVDQVAKAREKADKRAADVKAAGAAYFEQWEKQLADMNNPEIRQLSEERKKKLNEIFGNFGPLLEQTNADFDAFYSDLKDLRSFLSQDLTIAGMDAAKGIIKNTRESGDAVDASLDDLIAEMNAIEAAITPSKGAPKE